jgi:hypothetical protein
MKFSVLLVKISDWMKIVLWPVHLLDEDVSSREDPIAPASEVTGHSGMSSSKQLDIIFFKFFFSS